MPKNEPDAEDPLELVGVELPAAADGDLETMADCFIEEFARMGWDKERILLLFKEPFYASAHRILQLKGEAFVRERLEGLAPLIELCAHRREAGHGAGE